MPFRIPEEAFPPRTQPLLAACVAVGLVGIAGWMAVAARRGGGLVHHDAAPTVPLTYSVDVNSASTAELLPLPGLGPAMAARIVDHRASHGPFTRPEDLLDVPGIGPATLDRLRPHLRPLPAGGVPR